MRKEKNDFFIVPAILAAFVLAIIAVSCKLDTRTRVLNVSIPEHMWERSGSLEVWYTLKWTYKSEVLSLDIPATKRNAEIEVPCGETTIICAYPFGNMQPCGAIIASSGSSQVYLNQNDGYIASMLIDSDRNVTSHFNYEELKRYISDVCNDFRSVDEAHLLADILNGKVSESSVITYEYKDIPFVTCPSGLWIGESIYDGSFTSANSVSPELKVIPGIHRYYCHNLKKYIELAVDTDGNYYASPPRFLR